MPLVEPVTRAVLPFNIESLRMNVRCNTAIIGAGSANAFP
jgi:hypothetical protein